MRRQKVAIPSLVQHQDCLPAPDGPFALALRIYWPEKAALDGTWTPPPVKKA